jgi:4-amino-4-deoxy-L-arabinose transferase-like glycosyltransferase
MCWRSTSRTGSPRNERPTLFNAAQLRSRLSALPRTFWSTKGLGSVFDFAVSSNRRAVFMLVIASLLAFLPGVFQIPPIDRDEPHFAQKAKQMLETGDYVDLRFQDEAHYTKPVGMYWLQAATVKTAEAFGVPDARLTIWLYRLPSLFGAAGAVLATYWCALAFVGRRSAALAALMMAGSILIGAEARLARADAMLLFTVVTAMSVLARAYLFSRDDKIARPGWALLTVFWTALAAGILVKGLVIVMIVGLTGLTLSIIDRSLRWIQALRPLYGVVWLGVLVLPWFIAIYARTGNAFLLDSVVHDTLGKIANSQESHGGPPGYYLVLFFATFFPGCILAGLAAPAVWAKRREAPVRFLLAWLVPSWLVFELSVTKLPHYVMPLYPAIAILTAGAVEAKLLYRRRWLKSQVIWWFLAPVLLSITAVAGAIAIDRDLVLSAWPFFAAAIVCGFLAWQLYDDEGAERALMRATAATVLLSIGIYSMILPRLGPLFPSVALAGVLRESGCTHPVAASAGYGEPSLVFLAGTETRFTDASAAADFLHEGDCRFAFIETHQEPAFAQRAEALGLRYERGPRVEAFNFSKGQPITIAVFRSAREP